MIQKQKMQKLNKKQQQIKQARRHALHHQHQQQQPIQIQLLYKGRNLMHILGPCVVRSGEGVSCAEKNTVSAVGEARNAHCIPTMPQNDAQRVS